MDCRPVAVNKEKKKWKAWEMRRENPTGWGEKSMQSYKMGKPREGAVLIRRAVGGGDI